VFETDEQSASKTISEQKAAEISADWVTTFYHVQVGAIESQEFRTVPIPHWRFCFSDTITQTNGCFLPFFCLTGDTQGRPRYDPISTNGPEAIAAFRAALYTEDAVLVNDTGPIYGREAIEKHYADLFKQIHFSNHIITADQYSPHIIGTAGNEAWTSGEWTTTLKGQNFGPVDAKGNWVEIYHREGDDWKIRLDIWNVSPPPAAAATPSPTTTPK